MGGDEYAFVEKPVEWFLELRASEAGDDEWVCRRSPETLQSGLYLRGEVMGDYNYTTFPGRHRRQGLNTSFIEVDVADQSGEIDRTLFFDTTETIEVPLDDQGNAKTDSILGARTTIEIVLREGEECHVSGSDVLASVKSSRFLEKST